MAAALALYGQVNLHLMPVAYETLLPPRWLALKACMVATSADLSTQSADHTITDPDGSSIVLIPVYQKCCLEDLI